MLAQTAMTVATIQAGYLPRLPLLLIQATSFWFSNRVV